jgi:hypothetical protein
VSEKPTWSQRKAWNNDGMDPDWKPPINVAISSKELADLKAQLAEAVKVIEFYASKESWESDDKSRSTGNKTFDVCLFDFDRSLEPKKDYAGAKARAFLKKHQSA